MTHIKFAVPGATAPLRNQLGQALSLTGHKLVAMPKALNEARRRQQAMKAIQQLDTRTIEDVCQSRAHAIKMVRRAV